MTDQPVSPAPQHWSEQFNSWWLDHRVKQVLNPGGFARMVWHAAVNSVSGAMDSTPSFYLGDEGSIPSGRATPAPAPAAITDWYTPDEIRARVASHDYSAELMLQHALHWLPTTPAPAVPAGDLDPNEDNPYLLWAEIARLSAAVAGPDGYESWQAAATAERVRRARAEVELAKLRSPVAGHAEPAWRDVVEHAATELEELDEETAQAQAAALRELLDRGPQAPQPVEAPHATADLASARAVIEQCRAALAEELSAWDIDPPLHHVKEAHVRGDSMDNSGAGARSLAAHC